MRSPSITSARAASGRSVTSSLSHIVIPSKGKTSSRRHRALPQAVADGALFFVITMVLFGIAGAVWGGFFPTTQLKVLPNEGLEEVPGTADSGFRGFLIFAGVTCALGLILAWFAFRKFRRGLGQLLWVTACIACGTWWFIFLGLQVVTAVTPDFDANSAQPGDILHIVDFVSPWPGIMLAPAVAMLTYWIGAVTSSDEEFLRHP